MSCSLYQDSEKPPAAFSRRSDGTVRLRIRFIPLLAVALLDGLSRHPIRVFYVVSPLKTRHGNRSSEESSAAYYAIEYDS